jgi:hypothetical protein
MFTLPCTLLPGKLWHNRLACRCHIGRKEVYLKKVCGADELIAELFKKGNGGGI